MGTGYQRACYIKNAVFCPGLKKGTVLLEGKGHFSARISFWGHFSTRNFILRAVSCSELLIEPVLTPSGWKLNYSNPCWHRVDENWTIRTRAATEWMKNELFEPVLTPSGWKLNYSNPCWHQVDENIAHIVGNIYVWNLNFHFWQTITIIICE